jgi:uncharacterized Tic20 family protein
MPFISQAQVHQWGVNMDSTDVDFVVKAKRYLRLTRGVTIVAIAVAVASWIVSILPVAHQDIARSISWGALFGGLLINSDFSLFNVQVTRASLIRALEGQLNREPEALMLVAQRKMARGA